MMPFKYIHPESIQEATECLKEKTLQKSVPMAGGSDLLGLMKENIAGEVKTLVNLKKIPGLKDIEYKHGKGFTIGALVTLAQLGENGFLQNKVPVVSQAVETIASPQLRNVGTLGGNLCQRPRCWYFRGGFDCFRQGGSECFAETGENNYHCVIGGSDCFIVHPSDMGTVLTSLNASVNIQSAQSEKVVSLTDFYVLPTVDLLHETILKQGEVVTHILIPDSVTERNAVFIKERTRESFDFATVSVAVCAEKKGRKIVSGTIVLGGVAPVPWIELECSRMLSGAVMDAAAADKIAQCALGKASPLSENKYKVILARNLIKRALMKI